MGSTSVEVKGDGESSFSFHCGDIRVLLINELPPDRSIVPSSGDLRDVSRVSPTVSRMNDGVNKRISSKND